MEQSNQLLLIGKEDWNNFMDITKLYDRLLNVKYRELNSYIEQKITEITRLQNEGLQKLRESLKNKKVMYWSETNHQYLQTTITDVTTHLITIPYLDKPVFSHDRIECTNPNSFRLDFTYKTLDNHIKTTSSIHFYK